MPTSHMYILLYGGDPKDEIDALEAKGNALGLGPLKITKDIARSSDKSYRRPLRRRHYGYKLYIEARPGDTVVFPAFGRGFSCVSDFAHNLKRWVTAGIRVIVIDLGIDTAAEFGRNWTAVFLALVEANRKTRDRANAGNLRKTTAKGANRGMLGLVRKGQKGSRYFQVDPTLYELGLKCQQFLAQEWSYDDIETHLWKNKIFRILKFAPKVLAVEALRDPLFARKWTASAIRTLVRNIEKINDGVLAGTFRLPRTWRPTSGPLAGIPFHQPSYTIRAGSKASEAHWNQAVAIGKRVRELRKERGWTQPELGRRCGGIAQSQIADVERGAHNPRSAFLAKLANALGVPIETFDLKPAAPV